MASRRSRKSGGPVLVWSCLYFMAQILVFAPGFPGSHSGGPWWWEGWFTIGGSSTSAAAAGLAGGGLGAGAGINDAAHAVAAAGPPLSCRSTVGFADAQQDTTQPSNLELRLDLDLDLFRSITQGVIDRRGEFRSAEEDIEDVGDYYYDDEEEMVEDEPEVVEATGSSSPRKRGTARTSSKGEPRAQAAAARKNEKEEQGDEFSDASFSFTATARSSPLRQQRRHRRRKQADNVEKKDDGQQQQDDDGQQQQDDSSSVESPPNLATTKAIKVNNNNNNNNNNNDDDDAVVEVRTATTNEDSEGEAEEDVAASAASHMIKHGIQLLPVKCSDEDTAHVTVEVAIDADRPDSEMSAILLRTRPSKYLNDVKVASIDGEEEESYLSYHFGEKCGEMTVNLPSGSSVAARMVQLEKTSRTMEDGRDIMKGELEYNKRRACNQWLYMALDPFTCQLSHMVATQSQEIAVGAGRRGFQRG